MRPDMHELLVERPRWGHQARYPRAYVRNRFGDDLPTREAMNRKRYGDKQLSEYFAPLVRFLRTNVGRPWSKVHSEMASVLAPSSAVQKHVLDHLADFLATRTFDRDGTLWATDRHGRPHPLVARPRRDTFFVHPRTGILSILPSLARKVPPANPNVLPLSPLTQLRRIGGLWFHLTLAARPPWSARKSAIDVLIGRPVEWTAFELYPEFQDIWRSGHYTVARRQIGKRELARVQRSLEQAQSGSSTAR